jgi:hypothetical protein
VQVDSSLLNGQTQSCRRKIVRIQTLLWLAMSLRMKNVLSKQPSKTFLFKLYILWLQKRFEKCIFPDFTEVERFQWRWVKKMFFARLVSARKGVASKPSTIFVIIIKWLLFTTSLNFFTYLRWHLCHFHAQRSWNFAV